MLRRLRWKGVVPGAAVTILLWLPLAYIVVAVIAPLIQRFAGMAPVNGVASVTAREETVFYSLFSFSLLFASLLAFFVGGLAAGAMVRSASGLNGMASAVVVVMLGFAVTLEFWLPHIVGEDYYTRTDVMGTFLFRIMTLCVVSPFVVFTGYLGGRLGGRLSFWRSSTALR